MLSKKLKFIKFVQTILFIFNIILNIIRMIKYYYAERKEGKKSLENLSRIPYKGKRKIEPYNTNQIYNKEKID